MLSQNHTCDMLEIPNSLHNSQHVLIFGEQMLSGIKALSSLLDLSVIAKNHARNILFERIQEFCPEDNLLP